MTHAEVVVLEPMHWFPQLERVAKLGEILCSDPPNTIAGPRSPHEPPDPDTSLTIVDPTFWGSHIELLLDGLYRATLPDGHPDLKWADVEPGSLLLSEPDGPWTMTVEQAARCLGISRALAYESVRSGDIPSLRIGRRILVPIQALRRLLDSAGSQESPDHTDRTDT